MSVLNYIPAVFAGAATLIAVLGKPKWDPQKRGVRRLTGTAWVTLTVATLALVVSSVLTFRSQQAADVRRNQHERITRVAHTELRLALQDLSNPFVGIIYQAKVATFPGYSDRNTSGLIFPFCMLDALDRRYIAAATQPGAEWRPIEGLMESIKNGAIRATAAIDRTLQIYAAYLDSDVLVTISELRHSNWLFLLLHLDEQTWLQMLNIEDEYAYIVGYEYFWMLVVQLDQKLFRDEADLRLWGPQHPRMRALKYKE